MSRFALALLFPLALVGCEESTGGNNGGGGNSLPDQDRQDIGDNVVFTLANKVVRLNVQDVVSGRIPDDAQECASGSASIAWDGDDDLPPLNPFDIDHTLSSCELARGAGRPEVTGTISIVAPVNAESGTVSGSVNIVELGVNANAGIYGDGDCTISGTFTFSDDDGVLTNSTMTCGEYVYQAPEDY